MEVVFGREFIIELKLSEANLHDLLLELNELIGKEDFEELQTLGVEIKKAIDASKGFTLIETE